MVLSGRKKWADISNMNMTSFETLETFFESINRSCPELKRKNAPNLAAMEAVQDVYPTFNAFLSQKADRHDDRRLKAELKKINEFLESEDTKFLVDNVLSFADCFLLPRLQHIRVAGEAYRGFEIPKEYTACGSTC
ncbi:chloride intracellular channel protein 4-like [Pomacea canaliculata]|uniref:chloride intracellular channel protein 4-like n=1 Tax=Pomacea canaliculata TaxID=400727 RepID=UPI000D72DE96|nr:chloride intracellular channel protein 4-like [Pomacea canaliculata]